MQYILNEEEYQTFRDAKFWQAEFARISKMFEEKCINYEALKRSLNKQLADKAHQLLIKEVELASLSSELRKVKLLID